MAYFWLFHPSVFTMFRYPIIFLHRTFVIWYFVLCKKCKIWRSVMSNFDGDKWKLRVKKNQPNHKWYDMLINRVNTWMSFSFSHSSYESYDYLHTQRIQFISGCLIFGTSTFYSPDSLWVDFVKQRARM